MGCLSLELLKELLIWIVVIVALIMIVRLLLPFAASALGEPWSAWVGFLGQLLNIVIGAIVIIAIIVLVFDLLECVVGVPRLR